MLYYGKTVKNVKTGIYRYKKTTTFEGCRFMFFVIFLRCEKLAIE